MAWDDVRFFLALARHGAVRPAGASLGVSHTTVARRVEALEERLHVRLFDRTPDGYHLTPAGQGMIPAAERVELEIAGIERELLGRDERLEGTVRITCTDEYLADSVVRGLSELCRIHPGIDLEIAPSHRAFDLSKREADIALRIYRSGKMPPDHLLGRRLTAIHYAHYVALAHAQRLDPEVVGTNSRWLGWGTRKADEEWVSRTSYPQIPVWGSFGGTALQLQAARAGLGIAMLPCFVADRQPDLRRLRCDDRAP